MRKRFAEDELLGSFRLKQKPGLRIDSKPTPPEQVEDMIKELEPVLESLSDLAPTTSNLSLDWDISSIEAPAHLPTEEELKALLAFEPTREDISEAPEIFRTQRHQKMLELLERVEALTRSDNDAMTSEGTVEIKNPDSSLFAQAKKTANTQAAFSNKSGEDHEMRSRAESQHLKPDRSAASVAQTPPKPSEAQGDLKLNLEQVEFQERLIRILNENYGDLGEVRPHNLKARLIEILNEEYAEDEDFQENEKAESEVPLADEKVGDDPASLKGQLEETGPSSVEDQAEGLIKDSVLQGFENAAAQRQSRASQPLAGPRVEEAPLKTHDGFLSASYHPNMQDFGHTPRFSKNASERSVKRSQDSLGEFQYVTSFQEVTEDHADEASSEAFVKESPALAVEAEPETETEIEVKSESEIVFATESEPDSEPELVESEPPISQSAEEPISKSAEAVPRVLEKDQPAHFRDEEHPWLKELQSEGHPHPHDTSMSETSQSLSKAERSTYKVKEAALNQREAGEKDFKDDLLSSEASSPPRAQGERSVSVEEWSFVLDTMKEQIEYLKKQLEIKDHQLQNKDELIRNFQILLKNEQDKFLKLEHKMDDVVAQVEERATKKGFFSRFRKR